MLSDWLGRCSYTQGGCKREVEQQLDIAGSVSNWDARCGHVYHIGVIECLDAALRLVRPWRTKCTEKSRESVPAMGAKCL